MCQLQFNSKEIHFIMQGLNALVAQANEHESKLQLQQHPDDANMKTILEYYGKRKIELWALKKKIQGLVSAS